MGLKIFTIMLILFVAEITFLSTKQPKELKVSKEDINYSTIEFFGLRGSSIDKDGVSEKIIASRALKFKNHDEFYDINTSFIQDSLTHTLYAKQALFKNDTLYLTDHVQYENNHSMQINSEEIEYNTKTKIAHSPVPFTLTSKQGQMQGDTFVYDMKDGKLKGKKMHYTFKVDE